MNWQSKLRVHSRDPAYLWRMVIAIIGTGVVVGWIAEHLTGAPTPSHEPEVAGSWQHLEGFAQLDHWWQMWLAIPATMLAGVGSYGIVMLALFAGCCWLVFLWQVLRVQGPSDWRIWTTLVAIALGVLSIWPTIFFSIWQEYRWGVRESGELVPGLRYFILGVGLREEFAKLICLLPLLAILVPKRDEMAALVCSACVGLGFAVEENLNYFMGTQGASTMGRFLTANPYHMALTGLIGLSAYRACRDPKNWGPQALAVFFVLVMAHGLYDATIALPGLGDLSFAGMIIFALVMYQFFHEIRALRPRGRDTVSLTATFLCAVSLLAAATFVYISAVAGTATAADTLVGDIIGTALMVYLFLREMPETLVSV